MERRKSPRVRCRFPCEILVSGRSASGTVLDLSEGGLSVLAALEADQGTSLLIRLQAPGGEPIEVEALVWHSRRVRDRTTGKDASVLGLMVSRAGQGYSRLAAPARAGAPEPVRPSHESEPRELGEEELVGFRIRVKERSSPRTRILTLSAKSDEEARELAATHLEDGWEVLEVVAAEPNGVPPRGPRKPRSG
jgi:hypothetical protein